MNIEKILKAGKIASQVRDYIKPQIKKGVPLLEIAEKIEKKIIEFKGKPAFPTNLSINNLAAHYTPTYNDKSLAKGLLKIDFGVHVDGWISDTAFSIDLEDSKENKKLISASENALKNAIEIFKKDVKLNEIGKVISKTIEEQNFSPIINLSGHQIEQYDLHAGITIPNIDNKSNIKVEEGIYAIEPFTTNGGGKVHDGNPSNIYQLISKKNIRDLTARRILKFILEEYQTLPFCSRWIVDEFGTGVLFSLKQLEKNGNIHNFPQLIEEKNSIVAQSEHTILISKNCKPIITTL